MNQNTLLLRQVHPNFIPNGELTSQAFIPNENDEGKLSVYDGDQTTAADAHTHYTTVIQKLSHSVWGLSSVECTDQNLTPIPDALPNSPAHALIDFNGQPEKMWRKLAKALKAQAKARGCLFKPA